MKNLKNFSAGIVSFAGKMPRYFWILFFVIGISAGIVLLDRFRVYSAETTFLVVQKNEKTTASADQTVENIARLPRMLSFYNGLLQNFPEIRDPWTDESDESRAKLWQNRVETSRVDGSGLIRLKITANTDADASVMASKVSLHLFSVIGRYYDIRTEIDIRTVDSPVSIPVLTHPWLWFFLSLLIGYIGAAIVSVSADFLFVFLRRPKKSALNRSVDRALPLQAVSLPGLGLFEERKSEEEKTTEEASAQTAVVLADTAESMQKKPVSFAQETILSKPVSFPDVSKSAGIPNLPVLEEGMSLEEYVFGSAASSAEEDSTGGEKNETMESNGAPRSVPEKSYGEPTPEELKRRLNQLLKGEL